MKNLTLLTMCCALQLGATAASAQGPIRLTVEDAISRIAAIIWALFSIIVVAAALLRWRH